MLLNIAERVGIFLNFIKWVFIATFLMWVNRQTEVNVKSKYLLFIPLINLKIILKGLKPRKKIKSYGFLFASVLFTYYQIIFPLLLFVFGIDTYDWYMDIIYSSVEGSQTEDYVYGYTYYIDLIQHSTVTINFYCALLSIIGFFELKRFR
ncbi:hypothetical protein [Flammeovirga sp. OC4]|uniref:hypothetical protein n=1 Tax=Flammeovirga sp. OC4 TaxID=1382345 RepID=UPI00155D9598|nr:hypothetical protein [Flammeovirga sp. OC4]